MFPSDGALIRTNVAEFVEGSKSVHATLIKDKHILVTHVINPKEVVVTQIAEEETREKSETEKPEKESNSITYISNILLQIVPKLFYINQ